MTAIVDAYAGWLKTSSVPKLFLKAEPGGILAGGRFADEIGRAIASWMSTLG